MRRLIRLLYYLSMERMKTQVELLKECCDIKDAACVRFQKRIAELEEENKKLKEERDLYKARNEELNENCFWLAKENKKLKEENKKLQNDLETVSGAYFDR